MWSSTVLKDVQVYTWSWLNVNMEEDLEEELEYDYNEDLNQQLLKDDWEAGRVIEHRFLPTWLKDNDCILKGYRPQLGSFTACFKSIFSIHTDTGNIWTHLIGNYSLPALLLTSWPAL